MCLKFLALRILVVGSYLFCVLKIHEEICHDEILKNSPKLFVDEVYPLKFYLMDFFVANVYP